MKIRTKYTCQLTLYDVYWDGKLLFSYNNRTGDVNDTLSCLYCDLLKIDYRKFFKMDILSKAGFIAAELLLRDFDREQAKEDMGIVLFNKSGSLHTDEAYQQTIQHQDNYFPSPAVFVYTLPNIVAGEIAIRNKIHGETAFFILPEYDPDIISETVRHMLCHSDLKYLLTGWVEVCKDVLDVRMMLCEAVDREQRPGKQNKVYYNSLLKKLLKWMN